MFSKKRELKNELLENYLKVSIMFSNIHQLNIYNYNNVHQLNDNLIIIDSLSINGKGLKVLNIDDYHIKITGFISEVKFLEE